MSCSVAFNFVGGLVKKHCYLVTANIFLSDRQKFQSKLKLKLLYYYSFNGSPEVDPKNDIEKKYEGKAIMNVGTI